MSSLQPFLITEAALSFDEEQAHRRRRYAILMAVHIVGFALSYPLYLWQPWAGVAAVVLSGVLPWIAVLLANDAPHRRCAGVGAQGALLQGAVEPRLETPAQLGSGVESSSGSRSG